MRRLLLRLGLPVATALLVLGSVPGAQAADVSTTAARTDISLPQVPGLSDCKEAPTPDSPGNDLAGLFAGEPDPLPPARDPFRAGSSTTIYQQYGYAGLRWRNYDLGCGPDALRNPDAVIGTSVANWTMQVPIALTALTGSLTQVAFQPTFLGAFDPVVTRISTALHDNLFVSWIPAALAVLGFLIIFMARRQALATTAAAIGWALIVVMVTAGLFRWPVVAGHVADSTVTGTVGQVVGRLDGDSTTTDPGVAVASHVEEAILYRAWLAGTLGNPDSATAKKYGPDLFKAQALTWREAARAKRDPDAAKSLIQAKQKQWSAVAGKVKEADPEAYAHLTGARSETRVGYAVVSAVAALLSLPFLLLSALLMLGCFLIVRLAVMLFPAFAVLGVFPSSRGLVTSLGKTVAASVVNSIVFGIGAGVTVAVLGILFHPGGGSPAWLSLVLMPLFSLIMWHALRPFRRLTAMVNPDRDHLGGVGESLGSTKRLAKKLVLTGVGAAVGGTAGAAAANALDDDEPDLETVPDRAEARPSREGPRRQPLALEHSGDRRPSAGGSDNKPPDPSPPRPSTPGSDGSPHGAPFESASAAALRVGFVPRPTSGGVPPPPTEPEWYDDELVYPIYRPSTDEADDVA